MSRHLGCDLDARARLRRHARGCRTGDADGHRIGAAHRPRSGDRGRAAGGGPASRRPQGVPEHDDRRHHVGGRSGRPPRSTTTSTRRRTSSRGGRRTSNARPTTGRPPSYRSGASHRDLILASVRAHWETYKQYLAEMVGVFQFAMINEEFAERWRGLRAEAIESIAIGVERAQQEGYCPGANPRLVASAIVAMLNQFSYTWLAEGGEGDRHRLRRGAGDQDARRHLVPRDLLEAERRRRRGRRRRCPPGRGAPRRGATARPPATPADGLRRPSCRAGSTYSNGEPARSATKWRSSTTADVASRTGRCSTGSSAAPAGGPPPV